MVTYNLNTKLFIDTNDIIVDLYDTSYAIGCQGDPFSCEQDLAILTAFFQNSAFFNEKYIIELKATNGQEATGIFNLI